MSTDIIYHQLALRFRKDVTGTPEDWFAIAAQIGSSNCYEVGRGTRACGRRGVHLISVSKVTVRFPSNGAGMGR